jgi:hypothetical protein
MIRLRVFENRAMRILFEWKGQKIGGKFRILRNEGPHNLSFLPNIIKEHEITGSNKLIGEPRSAFRNFVGMFE